jgi:methionine salvage enolase-phosphatase E1
VLFISDALKEVEAAQAAGMRRFLCDRSEQSVGPAADAEVIHSFDEVYPV